MSSVDFAIRSRRILLPDGERAAALLIRGGRIEAVVEPDAVPDRVPIEDFGSLVLMAGLVDTHVHVNEPGHTEWEGFETATRAAAAGGIATIVDMPLNSIPVTTTRDALELKRDAARGRCLVDCGFWGGVIPGNVDELAPMIDAGVCGFKAFLVDSGIDEFPAASESDLRAALRVLATRGVPLLAHAELALPGARGGDAKPSDYRTYLASRPPAWENEAIRLLVRLCRDYHSPIHVVHLSSAEALPLLLEARREGLPITAETCPHYLSFDAESIPDGETQFKCAPPIRARPNREHLWTGLREGLIDFVVSDHSPCAPGLKAVPVGNFMNAWGGIASLQLTLSAVWTEARERGFSLADITRWMSSAPAAFAGLGRRKGHLAPGSDADVVAWDPEATFTVREEQIHHRHKLTPYLGRRLRGVILSTYVRGRKVYDRGTFAEPSGELLAPSGHGFH
jgi:allantoinase